jgi:hypothetical protein
MHLHQGGPRHASACCRYFPRRPSQRQRVHLDIVRYSDALLSGNGARLTEDAIFPDMTEILGLRNGHCDSVQFDGIWENAYTQLSVNSMK